MDIEYTTVSTYSHHNSIAVPFGESYPIPDNEQAAQLVYNFTFSTTVNNLQIQERQDHRWIDTQGEYCCDHFAHPCITNYMFFSACQMKSMQQFKWRILVTFVAGVLVVL